MRLKGPIIKPRRVTPKEFADHLYEFRNSLLIGGLVLLLVIAGWLGYRALQAKREAAAQAMLTDALQILETASASTQTTGTNPENPSPPEQALAVLNQISVEYPSSRAAEQAILQTGNILFALGEFQGAFVTYQQYLEQYPSGSWLLLAGLGRAYALEAQKEYTVAASIFRNLAQRYRGNALTMEALLGLGRTLERAEDKSAAIEVYRGVMADYAGSTWSRQAEERVAILER